MKICTIEIPTRRSQWGYENPKCLPAKELVGSFLVLTLLTIAPNSVAYYVEVVRVNFKTN